MVFRSLHLFAGIGGGVLADFALGFKPIGAVEKDSFCRRVLLRQQLAGCLSSFPLWDDIRTFKSDNPETSDYFDSLRSIRDSLIIAGGFPCQDISIAGRGAGLSGEKSGLWSEFARVIHEVRPGFVFVENSPELVRRGLTDIVTEFARLRYSFTWGVVSAAAIGAPHLRRRFWGLAVSDSNLQFCQNLFEFIATQTPFPGFKEFCRSLSDSGYKRSSRLFWRSSTCGAPGLSDGRRTPGDVCREWGKFKPPMGRMVNEFSNWLDSFGQFDPDELKIPRVLDKCKNRINQLRALGNAQVPACAAVAFVLLLTRFLL